MTIGKVIHVLSKKPYDVYVGWAMARHGLKESRWGNPYRIGEDGTRQEVLEKYEAAARHWLEDAHEGPTLREELLELRGETLACWCCEPRDRILTTEDETVCHAQIILRLADELTKEEE